MSLAGDVLVFSTNSKRNQFVSSYYDQNGNKEAVSGSRKTMRSFNLGMSVRDFEEYLSRLDIDEAVPCSDDGEYKY